MFTRCVVVTCLTLALPALGQAQRPSPTDGMPLEPRTLTAAELAQEAAENAALRQEATCDPAWADRRTLLAMAECDRRRIRFEHDEREFLAGQLENLDAVWLRPARPDCDRACRGALLASFLATHRHTRLENARYVAFLPDLTPLEQRECLFWFAFRRHVGLEPTTPPGDLSRYFPQYGECAPAPAPSAGAPQT